jgi:hypothetical protein
MNTPITYWQAVRLARDELRNTGAAFVLFEYAGKWFELATVHSNPKQVCGARKKIGERCRSKSLHRGGKCKFHGGLSTGARSPEGKAKSIAAMQAGRWRGHFTDRLGK